MRQHRELKQDAIIPSDGRLPGHFCLWRGPAIGNGDPPVMPAALQATLQTEVARWFHSLDPVRRTSGCAPRPRSDGYFADAGGRRRYDCRNGVRPAADHRLLPWRKRARDRRNDGRRTRPAPLVLLADEGGGRRPEPEPEHEGTSSRNFARPLHDRQRPSVEEV